MSTEHSGLPAKLHSSFLEGPGPWTDVGSQEPVLCLKLGCTFPHPLLFCICKPKSIQRKMSRASGQRSCKAGALNPSYPSGIPIMPLCCNRSNLSPVKTQWISDICYFIKALLIHLFPKASVAIGLSPAHPPGLHSCQFWNKQWYPFPIRPSTLGRA